MQKGVLLVLSLFITLGISSCKRDGDDTPPPIKSLVGEWRMNAIVSLVDGPLILKPTTEQGEVLVQILDEELRNFTGTTPAGNSFQGRFSYLGGQKLKTEQFSITNTAPETSWGWEFVSRIERVEFYVTGQQLELYTNAEKIVLVKQETKPD